MKQAQPDVSWCSRTSSTTQDNMKLDTRLLLCVFLSCPLVCALLPASVGMVDLRNTKGRVEETCCEKVLLLTVLPTVAQKAFGKVERTEFVRTCICAGITNPSLEVSLSPSACQFSLLEDLNHDIVLNCQDHTKHKKIQPVSFPVGGQAQAISSKCCRTCTQCSGCEGLDIPEAEEYEKDSPGKWYSERPELDREESGASTSEGQGSSGPGGQ